MSLRCGARRPARNLPGANTNPPIPLRDVIVTAGYASYFRAFGFGKLVAFQGSNRHTYPTAASALVLGFLQYCPPLGDRQSA